VGTGTASVCTMGAEYTATRGSCARGMEGKGPTDGTHGSARVGERTGGWAYERGPRDSERRCARRGDRHQVGPTGQREGEGGESGRNKALTGEDGALVCGRGRARGWAEMGLLG
jgi:hypothetical protein